MMAKDWATQMLKTIVQEYEHNPARFSDPGLAMDIWELVTKAGIFSDKLVSLQDFNSGHPFRDAIDAVLADTIKKPAFNFKAGLSYKRSSLDLKLSYVLKQ